MLFARLRYTLLLLTLMRFCHTACYPYLGCGTGILWKRNVFEISIFVITWRMFTFVSRRRNQCVSFIGLVQSLGWKMILKNSWNQNIISDLKNIFVKSKYCRMKKKNSSNQNIHTQASRSSSGYWLIWCCIKCWHLVLFDWFSCWKYSRKNGIIWIVVDYYR